MLSSRSHGWGVVLFPPGHPKSLLSFAPFLNIYIEYKEHPSHINIINMTNVFEVFWNIFVFLTKVKDFYGIKVFF